MTVQISAILVIYLLSLLHATHSSMCHCRIISAAGQLIALHLPPKAERTSLICVCVCVCVCLHPLLHLFLPCNIHFAGQHIALHEPPKDDHIGLICTACSPVQVAQDAINDARYGAHNS